MEKQEIKEVLVEAVSEKMKFKDLYEKTKKENTRLMIELEVLEFKLYEVVEYINIIKLMLQLQK